VELAKESEVEEHPVKRPYSACLRGAGRLSTAITPNASREVLLPIIEEQVTPDSI